MRFLLAENLRGKKKRERGKEKKGKGSVLQRGSEV